MWKVIVRFRKNEEEKLPGDEGRVWINKCWQSSWSIVETQKKELTNAVVI